MTAQTLREWFTTFNAQYFGNILPEPHFVVNHAKRTLGQFSCHKVQRGLLPGRWKTTGYTIKVSEFYNTSDHDRQSVLLHEMIHFYIAYTQTRDTSAHGKVFRQWMQRLNADGWNITITSRNAMLATVPTTDKQQYLLLAIRLSNGKCYLSVVNPAYRHHLEQMIHNHCQADEFHWLRTNDSRYAGWSAVRTLRGKHITQDEWERLMSETVIL